MTEPEPVTTDILPDPTLDSKSFKKLLMDRLRAQGGSQAVDTKQLFQSMVKETLEAFLELEMEQHLGYAKHNQDAVAATRAMALPPKPCAATLAKSKSKPRAIATLASHPRSSPNARPRSGTSAKRSFRSMRAG
jgi:hypothetical protein